MSAYTTPKYLRLSDRGNTGTIYRSDHISGVTLCGKEINVLLTSGHKSILGYASEADAQEAIENFWEHLGGGDKQ